MKSPLDGSVGKAGANRPKETKFVQLLLNDWIGSQKKALLKIDGIVGPKTLSAITEFQKNKKLSADGRIDVKGLTIQHLMIFHLKNLSNGLYRNSIFEDSKVAGHQPQLNGISPPIELLETYFVDLYNIFKI